MSKDDLLALYKISIEEYRFSVGLNWERTKFYLTLNSALLGVAAGLFRLPSSRFANAICLCAFICGWCVAILAIATLHQGNIYYRQTVYQKTLFEQMLGLLEPLSSSGSSHAMLGISTTASMKEAFKIINYPSEYIHEGGLLGTGTIKRYVVFVLLLMWAINLAGTVSLLVLMNPFAFLALKCEWMFG